MLTLNSLQWLHISFFGINTFNACKIILQCQNAGYSTAWNQFPVGQEGISSRMSMLASTEIIQWQRIRGVCRCQDSHPTKSKACPYHTDLCTAATYDLKTNRPVTSMCCCFSNKWQGFRLLVCFLNVCNLNVSI